MKSQKMLSSMELIDEKYIEEASPSKGRARNRFWIKFGAIAACISILVTSFALWLFVPYDHKLPDVSMYEDSEYYSLITKLNELTYRRPHYSNNYERYVKDVLYGLLLQKNCDVEVALPDAVAPENDSSRPTGMTKPDTSYGNGDYEETTDNQVAGVIEADLIKRSDKYIFYLSQNIVRAYSINGEDSQLVGTCTVDMQDILYYYVEPEAYLSEDCNTFTIILPYIEKGKSAVVEMVSIDVSDPTDMQVKKRVTVSGFYVSSRMKEGKLLLINNFNVTSPDFSDESTFIPQIDTGNGEESIPVGDIICPETPVSPRYTVVGMFDSGSLEMLGSVALLSYSQQLYVSADSIYATFGYTDKSTEDGVTTQRSMTEISRVRYADGTLELKGTFSVEGYIKDQYSLDEKDGVLRVVTTSSESRYSEKHDIFNDSVSVMPMVGRTNACLFCIDTESGESVAEVKYFAPEGETVRSVRFDGDAAYVCTSIMLSDPVFFFDLSDLGNITYKDTGTIEGFSTSLVNFGDGFLLGIGVGEDWNVFKTEIYREYKDSVISVCSYEREYASYSTNYKSYLIDRENSLVGLVLNGYGPEFNGQYYVLLHFNGYSLKEVVKTELLGHADAVRAVYIDEYLYMLSPDQFKVERVFGE